MNRRSPDQDDIALLDHLPYVNTNLARALSELLGASSKPPNLTCVWTTAISYA
jgi:hypothetical protein